MVKEGTWLPQHVDGDNTKENGAVDISRAKLFSAIYRALIRSQAPCKCFRCVFFLGSLAQDHTTTQGHRWSLKPRSSPAPLATVGPASSRERAPLGGLQGNAHRSGSTTLGSQPGIKIIKGKTPVGSMRTCPKHRPPPVQVTSEKTPNLHQSNEKTSGKGSWSLRAPASRCEP